MLDFVGRKHVMKLRRGDLTGAKMYKEAPGAAEIIRCRCARFSCSSFYKFDHDKWQLPSPFHRFCTSKVAVLSLLTGSSGLLRWRMPRVNAHINVVYVKSPASLFISRCQLYENLLRHHTLLLASTSPHENVKVFAALTTIHAYQGRSECVTLRGRVSFRRR